MNATLHSTEELWRDEALCRVRVPKNGNNKTALRRNVLRFGCKLRSKCGKRLGFAPRTVIDRELVTVIEQIARHRESQFSKPDPPDPLTHSDFLPETCS
jgi:hypothetical protein